MSTGPASASEAMEMVRAGLGYLAAADATAMAAETQAQCLRMLEQATAMGTAARASVLAAFTSGQGYSADADYSPRTWLINRTRITKAPNLFNRNGRLREVFPVAPCGGLVIEGPVFRHPCRMPTRRFASLRSASLCWSPLARCWS